MCEKVDFRGKKALVIGGSGGIGAAISRKLAQTGAELIIHGGHDSKKFDSLVQELKPIDKLVFDFSSSDSYSTDNTRKCSFFEKITTFALLPQVKSADIISVCFGPFMQKPLHEMSGDDWNSVATLDFALPGMIVSAVLPHMITAGWGRILLFGGTRTDFINGFRTNAAYGSAKTAVCSLVKSVASCYGKNGITANAILPGFVETEYLSDAQIKQLASKMPDGRLIDTETIATAGLFLLSHTQMNGVLFPVDSGWRPDEQYHVD